MIKIYSEPLSKGDIIKSNFYFNNPNVNSTASDPLFDDVVLLLVGDGSIQNIISTGTLSSTATVNTNNKKYGTGSINFNGSQTIKFTPDNVITSDITIEAWIYSANNWSVWPPKRIIFWKLIESYLDRFSTNYIQYDYSTDNKFTIYLNPSTQGGSITSNNNTAIPSQWQHIAFVKAGNSYSFYINGAFINSISLSGTFNIEYLVFGGDINQSASFIGQMDSIRVTKVARYTTSFNPETDTYLAY